MSEEEIYDIQLAVDEACSNIIEHAYGVDQSGDIECSFSKVDDGLLVILHDHGRPFDLSKVPEPDLTSGLNQRPIGGLGLHFMRSSMDEIHYESKGEIGNVLMMIKRHRKQAG